MNSLTVANMGPFEVGDIITVDGSNHKITKVSTTAIAVTRYYWFDRLYDKFDKWLNRWTNGNA